MDAKKILKTHVAKTTSLTDEQFDYFFLFFKKQSFKKGQSIINPANNLICRILSVFDIEFSGERGIRTPGTFYSTPDFESGTLNRSDISPG